MGEPQTSATGLPTPATQDNPRDLMLAGQLSYASMARKPLIIHWQTDTCELVDTEEPDERIVHVRICGGAGWATASPTRNLTRRGRDCTLGEIRTRRFWFTIVGSAKFPPQACDETVSCMKIEDQYVE